LGRDAPSTAEDAMPAYILKRVLYMIPTLIGVAVLIFLMLRVVPGDIVELKLRGDGGAPTMQDIAAERARLGLDKPIIQQFGDWMVGLATFNLGNSMWTERPVVEEISGRFGLTLQVAIMATIIAILIAVPLGTISALYKDTWVDQVVRLFAIGGMAIPSFWLGMIIILGLLYTFNWIPAIEYVPIWEDPLKNLSQLIWPSLAVGYRFAAVLARMIRSSIVEVLREDYIRTARAKGLYERLVIGRHALRNAMLPAITLIGLEFAFLIGGLVVTEQVFNLNGLGRLFVQAVTRSDFTMVQGIVMLIAVVFILTNLVVDLLYAALDPRIRYGNK
jgi:peptide/nickel transport system permease protein